MLSSSSLGIDRGLTVESAAIAVATTLERLTVEEVVVVVLLDVFLLPLLAAAAAAAACRSGLEPWTLLLRGFISRRSSVRWLRSRRDSTEEMEESASTAKIE